MQFQVKLNLCLAYMFPSFCMFLFATDSKKVKENHIISN